MAPAPKPGKIRGPLKPPARCRRSQKEEKQKRTPPPTRPAFLSTPFLPLLEEPFVITGRSPQQIERDFFTSLSYFADLYEYDLPDLSALPYPANMCYALRDAKARLKYQQPNGQLVIDDSAEKLSLVTIGTYDTGHTLYYVPIEPLYRLMQTKSNEPAKELLFSLFSYLLLVSGLPWFMDSRTCLYDAYQCLMEWNLGQDAESNPQAAEETIQHYQQMVDGAAEVLEQVKKRSHLQQFARRIKRFAPSTPNERALLEAAKAAYRLLKDYPHTDLFDRIPENPFAEGEDTNVAGQYLSFVWATEGAFAGQIVEYVNNWMGECAALQEPMSFQYFNQPQAQILHDFDFENRYFNLLNDVCSILNERL